MADKDILLSTQPDRSIDKGVETWLRDQIKALRDEIADIAGRHADTPGVNELMFYIITGIVASLIIACIIAIFTLVPNVTMIGSMPINLQWFIMLPIAVYLAAGFFQIDTDQIGGHDFFGTPVMVYESGLKWAPWGLYTLTTETIDFVQGEFPGDVDKIQFGDEKEKLEEGKVRPIYVLFGDNPNGKLPTDKQQNVGVANLIKIRQDEARLYDLVRNIAPIDESKKKLFLSSVTGGEKVSDRMLEALRHLRDTTAAFALEIAGKLTYNEATTHLSLVNEILLLRLQVEVEKWGIEVVEARFTKIDAGHEFNKKLQTRGTAMADRDAMIVASEGEKTKRINEGQGTAEARKALLEAEAAGVAAIMKETGLSGAEIVSAEVAKALANGQNNVIVADGLAGLAGMATAAAAQALNKKTAAAPAPASTTGTP